MATGRTVGKYMDFILDDSGGTLRSIPVQTVTGTGLVFEEMDVTALQDAIKNVLPGQPEMTIEIAGPLSNKAAASAGTLSGSHTILSVVNGGITPLSMDVQIGIQAAWTSGDPQFGITASATSGMLVTSYTVDIAAMTYAATLKVMGGTAPAWGTAAET